MITDEEFKKIKPGKTIVMVHSPEGQEKQMLVKFFKCDRGEDYDGYWLCCTEDMSNPYPHDQVEDDWDVYCNLCDIINY